MNKIVEQCFDKIKQLTNADYQIINYLIIKIQKIM